jgi:hypothetical protein
VRVPRVDGPNADGFVALPRPPRGRAIGEGTNSSSLKNLLQKAELEVASQRWDLTEEIWSSPSWRISS